MRLAYSTNAYRRFPVEEAIRRIASVGYRGVELMADVPHAWPADIEEGDIAALRRALEVHNLALSNINAFMTTAIQDFWHPSWIEPDEEFRRQRIEHTKAALNLAQKLGAACITTEPGGPLPAGMEWDAALDIFTEGLREALHHAEEVGVLLLVEPEPDLLIENADQFLALAERFDSPMFGLNFDIGHFYCVGEDVPEAIRRLQSFTRHYHIEDIAASRVHEHLIPGQGAIDFSAVLSAIRDTDYDGWITVELYPYLSDPDGAGREAREYLERRMPA
jgi:sugar phosphate isomerase/epimerase